LKEIYQSNQYPCFDKEFGKIDDAINHIEENNLDLDLKELVISEWEDIQKAFKKSRKQKRRV
jgi:hypothetical protein